MDEIKALEQISEIMAKFNLSEQRRMIWWLNARLVQRIERDLKQRHALAADAAD